RRSSDLLVEEGRARVLVRQGRRRYRPVDGQAGIVPADAGIGLAVIGRGDQVTHQGTVGEHDEAVRETFRYPEVAPVAGAQHSGRPLTEGGRTAADVHRHVPDLALEHADVLA